MEQQTESVDIWTFIAGAIGFLSDVAHGGTRLILTYDGKPLGCVVCMEDFKQLEQTKERR